MESYIEIAELQERYNESQIAVESARLTLQQQEIWRQKFAYNFSSQSNPSYVQDTITRCKQSQCEPSSLLKHPKLAIFQPVLEQVGVHHAWAKGLTGDGVRIAIEDDFVNYRLPEFEGRVQFEGGSLLHQLLPGDLRYLGAELCLSIPEDMRENCRIFEFPASESAGDLYDTLPFRLIVGKHGLPRRKKDDEYIWEHWLVLNTNAEPNTYGRWSVLATGGHGTIVASLASGRDHGVAPGATIIPVAYDFNPDGQRAGNDAVRSILSRLRAMPAEERREVDREIAENITVNYAHYDIINRSYGISLFDPASVSTLLNSETKWWGEGLRRVLPLTWRAFMQTDIAPEDRTIVVYAAGNESEEWGGFGADIPYYETHVRGSQISVMALNKNGTHAEYTNFCGSLPSNWDAGRWGRHFCLAAPGVVNAQSVLGWDWLWTDTEGTSFAAPIVSGAIALMMEHFRGQLGNTEIVKRMMNTANNQGHYSQIEIYGAGLLDLEAALKPIGTLATGTPTETHALAQTFIGLPSSIGNFAQRVTDKGVEIAALDEWGAPFWQAPAQVMGIQPRIQQMYYTPTFVDARTNDGHFHKGFMPDVESIPIGTWDAQYWHDPESTGLTSIRLLAGDGKIGIERSPSQGIRWGMMQDTESWMGSYPNGGFGNHVNTSMVWVGNTLQFPVSETWTLNASASIAYGHVDLPAGGMLEIDSYLMSTWDVGIEAGVRGEGHWMSLTVSQPLRAETGQGKLTYLSGLKQGEPLYEEVSTSLVPKARETQVKATYELPVGKGRALIDVSYAHHFLHEEGLDNLRIGLGYRLAL